MCHHNRDPISPNYTFNYMQSDGLCFASYHRFENGYFQYSMNTRIPGSDNRASSKDLEPRADSLHITVVKHIDDEGSLFLNHWRMLLVTQSHLTV